MGIAVGGSAPGITALVGVFRVPAHCYGHASWNSFIDGIYSERIRHDFVICQCFWRAWLESDIVAMSGWIKCVNRCKQCIDVFACSIIVDVNVC